MPYSDLPLPPGALLGPEAAAEDLYQAGLACAAGIDADETGRPKGSSALPFVLSAIAMILVSGMMRHIFAMAGIEGVDKGLVAGLGIGLFFISPWIMINNAYGMRPFRLTVIDGGYATLGCGLMGLVLALF